MTAVGLPTDPDYHVTVDEAGAIRLLAAPTTCSVKKRHCSWRGVTGATMARLAETIVGVFRLQVELPRRAGGTAYVDVVKEYAELTQTMLPNFVATLDRCSGARSWPSPSGCGPRTRSDRSSRWSEPSGSSTWWAIRPRRRRCRCGGSRTSWSNSTSALRDRRGTNGQIVKTIGDEAMFVTEHATDACHIALDLIDAPVGRSLRSGSASPAGEMASCSATSTGPTSTWRPGWSARPNRRRRWCPMGSGRNRAASASTACLL